MGLAEEFKVSVVTETATCPACGRPTLVVSRRCEESGYLEGVMELLSRCTSCSYRGCDVFPAAVGGPRRYTFKVSSPEDLDVRVVRSSTATVRIPELGVTIEPGPASRGFVSNVQGVLERVREAVVTARGWVGDDEGRRRCDERLASIDAVLAGGPFAPFKLVIEDLFGNSLIVSKRARSARLSAKDVERLVSRA